MGNGEYGQWRIWAMENMDAIMSDRKKASKKRR